MSISAKEIHHEREFPTGQQTPREIVINMIKGNCMIIGIYPEEAIPEWMRMFNLEEVWLLEKTNLTKELEELKKALQN